MSAARTHEPGKAYPHLAEQCGDAGQPPVFHMASPVAATTGRTQYGVVAGLRRDGLLLDERQQLLRFGKCQTQVGDLLKTIGSIELDDVHADRWVIDPGSNQPQNPPHS